MGAESKIEVVGCGERVDDPSHGCPFHRLDHDGVGYVERCAVNGRRIDWDEPERPEWCPLASGAMLVQLRVL